jgi:hypothetical protein
VEWGPDGNIVMFKTYSVSHMQSVKYHDLFFTSFEMEPNGSAIKFGKKFQRNKTLM